LARYTVEQFFLLGEFTITLFGLAYRLLCLLAVSDFNASGGDKRPQSKMPKEFYLVSRRAKYRA
jgi:hypothetical protein